MNEDEIIIENFLAKKNAGTAVAEKAADPVGAMVEENTRQEAVSIEAKDHVDQLKQNKGFMQTSMDAQKKGEKILGAAVPSISDVPIPTGGIGLLLFIALLMVFAITPADGKSGQTRLQIVWQTILGNYKMPVGGKGPVQPEPLQKNLTVPMYIQGVY